MRVVLIHHEWGPPIAANTLFIIAHTPSMPSRTKNLEEKKKDFFDLYPLRRRSCNRLIPGLRMFNKTVIGASSRGA